MFRLSFCLWFMVKKGGVTLAVIITGVRPQSVASRAKLRAGDVLTHIGDEPISDVLDYRFFMTDALLDLRIERSGLECVVRVEKDEYEDLGLEFESFLMDTPKTCSNRCIFCFIDQNPPKMRSSIYFKDDDDRLSFLMGNYITLTNLTDSDVERIVRMRLCPVNISVHATDPVVREQLMRNPEAKKALDRLRVLARGRIQMNVQLVLCPGINDGKVLQNTLDDLEKLFPVIQSVACVPVGLTGHRKGLTPLHPFTREEAVHVLDIVGDYAKRALRRHGQPIVFAADEFYIKAKRPFPPADAYGDFLQLENGVGMSALFESEFMQALNQKMPSGKARTVDIVTGDAAHPLLAFLCGRAMLTDRALQVRVHRVENRFFGGHISVAGLLTGSDLEKALAGKRLSGCLLIPSCMLRREGDLFLDDMTPSALSKNLGTAVSVVPNDGRALAEALMEGGCC